MYQKLYSRLRYSTCVFSPAEYPSREVRRLPDKPRPLIIFVFRRRRDVHNNSFTSLKHPGVRFAYTGNYDKKKKINNNAYVRALEYTSKTVKKTFLTKKQTRIIITFAKNA